MVNMELLRDHSVFHTAVAMPAYKVLSHHKHRPSDGKPNARMVRVGKGGGEAET